jgi:hypothetical protein
VSVLLTLAVVPAVYTLVARNTGSPQRIAKSLERLREARSGSGAGLPPDASGSRNIS